MGRSVWRTRRLLAAALVAVLASAGLGCAVAPERSRAYAYFGEPKRSDPWSPKIVSWQSRERFVDDAVLRAPAPVSNSGGQTAAGGTQAEESLRAKYFEFRSERKRALAREVAAWIQGQAREHYRADGPLDHWATLEETLAGDGDDCDGLELLTYHLLRDLGFRENEVYRAIVYQPANGQHHMVTLWFESSGDPWVIDPTGAMAGGMPRMSEVPGWVPLKIFSKDEEFPVRPASASPTPDSRLASRDR